MAPSAEQLLALALPALYLKDCLLLLEHDEAVLVRGAGGRWRCGFGAMGFRLGGREPYLANPFLPHQPVLRLRWRLEVGDAATAPGVHGGAPADAPALGALAVTAWASWIALFVLLPLVLLGRLGEVAAIGVIALVYASIAASLALVARRRHAWGVSGKALGLLAFECLACPPYAANIVRKVCALRPVQEDLDSAARRLLSPEQAELVRRACLARVREQLDIVDEGSVQALRLEAARKTLDTGAPRDAD